MKDESTIEIRRYPNRRLYDRSRRQYVTLQDIEKFILDGQSVVIRDSRNGEDLTRQILTQILMERHPDKMDMFPVAMLHSILRANDMAVELWRGYLRQSLAAMETWQKAASPFATPLDWMSAFLPMRPAVSPTTLVPMPPAESSPDLTQRLEELADRIARLESAGAPAAATAATPPASPDETPIERLEHRLERLEERPARKKAAKR